MRPDAQTLWLRGLHHTDRRTALIFCPPTSHRGGRLNVTTDAAQLLRGQARETTGG